MLKQEHLWPQPQRLRISGSFPAPRRVRLCGERLRAEREHDLPEIAGVLWAESGDAYPVTAVLGDMPSEGGIPSGSRERSPESYTLRVSARGATIGAAHLVGLERGMETLLQIAALSRSGDEWPELEITDWPQYRTRCFLVDMGRSVFPLAMLKRIVRILARLKMNQLLLHLWDDELCGIRLPGMPFGTENPYALCLAGLEELVHYAARWHVEVIPELEAWGHVGSLVYHRPELCGGEGMYRGSSFRISPQSFALMRSILEQVVPILPRRATVHLGLDEAKWFADPALGPAYTPEDMVGAYHDLLCDVGARHGRELTMRIWADHSGRPVPQRIQQGVIVEPWQYWISQEAAMDAAILKYSGEGKMRWIMGAGQSGQQFRGAWHATRYWCTRAIDSPNVEGVNVTFWCSNNLERNFISLFSGAFWAWNPLADTSFAGMDDYETYDRIVFPIMQNWQLRIPDAYPDDLLRDQGPFVSHGYHVWGERHGEPVAPTVRAAGTAAGLDYLSSSRSASPSR